MRPPRLKPNKPVVFYHVMTRTAQKAFLLAKENDPGFKEVIHRVISSMEKVYYVEIFSWVYMDNHIHLALSVKKPDFCLEDVKERFEELQKSNKYPRHWRPCYAERVYKRLSDLSWFMWEINRRIAIIYNKRHETSGHFWGGRFKSKVIENEDALLRVMTYIEQNPVRAKLCNRPSQYPWCSTGRLHRALKLAYTPKIPTISIFHGKDDAERARTYVSWMDYHTDVLMEKKYRRGSPPEELEGLCLGSSDMKYWREDFESREPSNWRRQGYGNRDFEDSVAHEINQLSRGTPYGQQSG